MSKRPITYAPRGLRAEQAAVYLGMGRSKFLELVEADRLPKPKFIDGMRIWDRLALDIAFEEFDSVEEASPNSFDKVIAAIKR